MRFLIGLIFVLLLGCAPAQVFDVTLSEAEQTEIVRDGNKTLDVISLMIKNNEPFALECDIFSSMSNLTNTSSKRVSAGVLESTQSKHVSVKFDMFLGKSDLLIECECRRASQ